MSIFVATVTYGRRWHLLAHVLDAAKDEGVSAALIIDNDAADPIRELAAVRYGGWATVHSLDTNLGSAAGFRAAIEQALIAGAEYILLLDDDNVLTPGCLKTLKDAFEKERGKTDHPALAVFGFRRDRHQRLIDQAIGAPTLRVASSFRGFHFFDITLKINRRIFPAPASAPIAGAITAHFAPYGGLFFHRSLINAIGLPRAEFVLYEDDTEFTNRLVRNGGKLLLVPQAEIIDLETSWNQNRKNKTSFSMWLDGESDLRAFYAFRNGVFSDLYCRRGNRVLVVINMVIYMSILVALGIVKFRINRLFLLIGALRDGITGQLGKCPRLPLTQTDGRRQADA